MLPFNVPVRRGILLAVTALLLTACGADEAPLELQVGLQRQTVAGTHGSEKYQLSGAELNYTIDGPADEREGSILLDDETVADIRDLTQAVVRRNEEMTMCSDSDTLTVTVSEPWQFLGLYHPECVPAPEAEALLGRLRSATG